MNFIQVLLIGIGLSMDISAVAMTNGLTESQMRTEKIIKSSLVFAFFQAAMPFIGYLVGGLFGIFFQRFMPIFALLIFLFLGMRLLIEGLNFSDVPVQSYLNKKVLIMQSAATSIDALAVGLLFSGIKFFKAIYYFTLMGFIAFLFCVVAIVIGKNIGYKLCGKARIFGALILIFMGLKLFFENI